MSQTVADRLVGQITIAKEVLRALDSARHQLRHLSDDTSAWREALHNVKAGEWLLSSKVIDGKPVIELLLNTKAPKPDKKLHLMRSIAHDLVVEDPQTPTNAVWLRAS